MYPIQMQSRMLVLIADVMELTVVSFSAHIGGEDGERRIKIWKIRSPSLSLPVSLPLARCPCLIDEG